MPISLIFPAVLLFWVASRMHGLLRDLSDPYDRCLAAGGMVIIGLLVLIIWHDFKLIVHSWGKL